ncbi:MAG TPA: cupin domain-containing protein [Streptosporangiaceae bacterium]|nr:cupin domain-containing protein [Streptosporangiaceae bacterium]
MHIITADSAPRFELPGVEFTGYAAPSRGSDGLCAWQITVAPGLVSDEAHMLDADEVFLVISGSITLSPDGQRLGAGDCAVVPAGSLIQLSNPGAEPATAHVLIRSGFTATMVDGSPVPTPPWAK